DIVAYGIGSIQDSIISQYQFALLLIFKNIFQITGRIYTFDPKLTQIDIEVLNHFEVELIKTNEAKLDRKAPHLKDMQQNQQCIPYNTFNDLSIQWFAINKINSKEGNEECKDENLEFWNVKQTTNLPSLGFSDDIMVEIFVAYN
ncbi:3243_t:CDS:2, partial [Diversispora eburnea]